MLFSSSAPTGFSWRCWRPNGALTATSLCFYCVLIRIQSHGAYFKHIRACAIAWRSLIYEAIPQRQMKMPLRVNQNEEPRRVRCPYLCMRHRMTCSDLRGDPTATNEDAVALLRCCRRIYCVYLDVLLYI